MKSQQSETEARDKDNDFTQRLSTSPYFPFSDEGILCPYLNDADLLFRLLTHGSKRQAFKKFCKAKVWPAKPNVPQVMNEKVLKSLLCSACNSPEARHAMSAFEEKIPLGLIIYDSIMLLDHTVHKACVKRLEGHKRDAAKRKFITPEMLREVISSYVEYEQHHEALHLLALSLAMFNHKQAATYIGELLQFFPDSAASMGCIDEVENSTGPSCESANCDEDTTDHSHAPDTGGFFCMLTRADELEGKWRAVKSAFDNYKMASDQLATTDDMDGFSDGGPIEALVNTLMCTRQLIAKSKLEIGEILGAERHCPDGLECALSQALGEFHRSPPRQIGQFISVANQIIEASTSVKRLEKSARTVLPSLESQVSTYLLQLGRADTDDLGKASVAFPCEALRATESMRDRIDKLKEEFETKLTNARTELEACCHALEETSQRLLPASGASLFNNQMAMIRRSLQVADNMLAIDDCRSQIRSLEESLRGASTAPDSTKLVEAVSRLQSNRDDTAAFLELCDALLEQGLHDVALLALLTRQSLYLVEEIGAELDRAIGTLVEAVCGTGDIHCTFSAIWHKVCLSSWLMAINRSDLTSVDLIERLAIMYVAEAISGNEENAAIGLLNLGISDCSDLSLPPSIKELIAAIVSHRSFRVVTVSTASRLDEKRKAIVECIAFENGKYRHIQCSKATHFAKFESVKVFPELERFWKEVSADVANRKLAKASTKALSADPDEWFAQMNKSHDRDMSSHPHFSVKIQAFVASFVKLVRDYVDECSSLIQDVDIVVKEQSLRQEIGKWAGNNVARQRVARCFTQQTLGDERKSKVQDPVEMLLALQNVITSCPSAVAWSLSQRSIQPTLDLETRIIEDIGHARSKDEIDEMLSSLHGWAHLRILWCGNDPDRESDYVGRDELERSALSLSRQKVIEYSAGSLVETYDECCNAGRFVVARQILDDCERHFASEVSRKMEETSSRAKQMLEELDHLKELAEDRGLSSEWVQSVYTHASGIERALKQYQRASTKGENTDDARLDNLKSSLHALTVAVQEGSNNFDAVKFHLEGGHLDAISSRVESVTEQDARECCPDLVDAWETLQCCTEDRVRSAWSSFVKLFGKHCMLYHDETDTTNSRFVRVAPFEYPYSIYQTHFYKPKSEFLRRPLRLYLFRDKVDNQALQRLDTELSIEQSAAELHVVFAPNGSLKLRKALHLDRKFRSLLVIDDSFLYRICAADKHDVPIRRGLHGIVADLVSSSPFVANGYCHQENNIYVGRSEVIQWLMNHPQAMIWGGRRIGKTSVLHALESTLDRRHYKVALVYADIHGQVDPDLAIAKRLANELNLPSIESLTEFEKYIQAERKKGIKFAFLLDEVDEYIKKSRLVHNGEFPLASALRKIVMEDSTKSTVLVYSGYHQLYCEAKLGKRKKRVGHPFVNIASDLPIRDLSHDEVVELVRTGFEEMLGIDLHPDVPSLVAERASRHPAFVQEFCRCLLDHVSRRRSHPQAKILISPRDVEDVYKADGRGDGGEQPFIYYVDETLGWNLSELGRAIMLTIETDEYYSKRKIFENLCEYADIADVKRPLEDQFGDTIDLLVMTNLLTQDPNRFDYYRMTYPTFIEILGRLNKLGKTEIEKSLKNYDRDERTKGILR